MNKLVHLNSELKIRIIKQNTSNNNKFKANKLCLLTDEVTENEQVGLFEPRVENK